MRGGRARLVVLAAVGAVAFLGTPSVPAAPHRSAPTNVDDPLAVYFRPDAVGRSQLALAITACGTERWTVKTGTDDDRHRVSTTVRDVSIKFLRGRSTPATKPQTGRVTPVETTIYRVQARLRKYVRENDGDYHLVLVDRAGRSIVAEIPAPSCVGSISPFKAAIRSVRARMDDHYTVTTGFKTANRAVVVRGIGFFDYFHGQTGMAPNDLELHPVIGLRFLG